MKKRLLPLLLCIIFLSSCTKNNTAKSDNRPDMDVQLTPQPHSVTLSDTASSDNYYGEPELTVTQTVAYIFATDSGKVLYTACEYKNNSHMPCIIDNVIYHISIGEKNVDVKADQPASEYCVISPGKAFYNAAWTDTDASADVDIKIESVEINVKPSEAKCIEITGDKLYIVRNYPSFASVSGELISTDDAKINLIYIGFYDAADKLIGVWCASEPSTLAAGNSSHFTMHMKDLPIDDLENTTQRMNVTGFGYNSDQ